jgi:hypothetical protein
MMQTLSVWVGVNIIYLYGTVNGVEATFTLTGGGHWEATVPRSEDDIYTISLQAYSVSGLEYEGTYTIHLLTGWITPKTDWTHDDYENVEDFNRQKHNVKYIATFALPLLDIYPEHKEISDVYMASIPLASILNDLEDNISEIGRVLRLTYPTAQLTLQQRPISGTAASGEIMRLPKQRPLLGDWCWGKTWSPGGVAPNYTDTNRWENNMSLVYQWVKRQPVVIRIRPSGTFYAGQTNILPRMVI